MTRPYRPRRVAPPLLELTYAELKPLLRSDARFCRHCVRVVPKECECGRVVLGMMIAERQGFVRIIYPEHPEQ